MEAILTHLCLLYGTIYFLQFTKDNNQLTAEMNSSISLRAVPLPHDERIEHLEVLNYPQKSRFF